MDLNQNLIMNHNSQVGIFLRGFRKQTKPPVLLRKNKENLSLNNFANTGKLLRSDTPLDLTPDVFIGRRLKRN